MWYNVDIVHALADNDPMSLWDEKKNAECKRRHGSGIEDLLERGEPTGEVLVHPKYPHQVRLIYLLDGYPWVLVYEPDRKRFANAWPSRKLKKMKGLK